MSKPWKPTDEISLMTEDTRLSDREKEVLQLVAEGMTNREIAQRLTISPNTVKVHLSNIFEKAGVASRTEATMYAIEHQIVDVPGGPRAAAAVPPPGVWQTLAQFRWVWLAIGLMLVTFLVTLSANLIFTEPEPETLVAVDVAERWQELAPMPEPRAGMAAVAYDGDIYAIAGEGPEGVSGSVFRYLPEDDRWERLQNKPTPVTDVEGALIGEKVYIPGGLAADGQPTDILEIYDPRQDSWSTGAPLPGPVSDYALADFEGKMYLFGGWDGEDALAVVWVYDPAEDSWGAGLPLPKVRRGAKSIIVSGELILIGGNDGEQQSDLIFSYCINCKNTENKWLIKSQLPENLIVDNVEDIADFIFVVGHTINESKDVMMLEYIVGSNTWSNLINRSYRKWFTDVSTTSYNKNLFFFGGKNNQNELLDSSWSFRAIYSVSIPIINQ